jgi:subtilisin family serine protease
VDALALVQLTALMERTGGSTELKIGLIDGPVIVEHPDLVGQHLREVPANNRGAWTEADSAACQHGTFVAGILSAKRGTAAPAICPDCTLLTRPIFAQIASTDGDMPSATPEELAQAILDCLNAGARVINLSSALTEPSTRTEWALQEALDQAAKREVIVVAAAGNQGTLGSTAITRHPWVIPIAAYDLRGRPMGDSNLGRSIGRRGLGAPGEKITSVGVNGTPLTLGGTSAAAPFVTGAIALLWSEFRTATASEVKFAVTQAHDSRRTTVAPPLLNAGAAYQMMRSNSYA